MHTGCMSLVLVTLAWMTAAQYTQWTNPGTTDTPLYCPDYCFSSPDLECCSCNSLSWWEIGQTNNTNSLYIEYQDIQGFVTSLISTPSFNASLPSTVKHTDGIMRTLPQNICSFPEIVSLILKNNSIENLDLLHCIISVEILDLSYNKISAISNTTFTPLLRLRNLDLSFNSITTIDSNAFQGKNRSIARINLSHSKLTTVDVSNMVFEKGFCEISYDGNLISEISNPSRFKLDMSKKYGRGGSISLRNCQLTQFINYSDIGLDNLSEFYKVFESSVDTYGSEIGCDCVLYPLIEKNLGYLQKVWTTFRDNTNLTCSSPSQLNGTRVIDLIDKTLQDKMTCEKKVDCPRKCHCYQQPSQRRLVVNCSEANLTELPNKLPWAANYSLLFGGNKIKSMAEREYLSRAYLIDLSHNDISHIQMDAVHLLKKDVQVDISDNKIASFPKELASKSGPGLTTGDVTITCDCTTTWIVEWKKYRSKSLSNFQCANHQRENILIVDELIRKECRDQSDTERAMLFATSGGLALVFLMLCSFGYIWYRPEILVLYRFYLRRSTKHRKKFNYDIYISFNENNITCMRWVLWKLLPCLQSRGLRVYLPCKDGTVGEINEVSRCFAIDNSRTYINIITENSNADPDDTEDMTILEIETFHCWNNFKKHPFKTIVVINFDNVPTKAVQNRYMKAFIRTGVNVNVTNRYHDLLENVLKRLLGSPPKISPRRVGVTAR